MGSLRPEEAVARASGYPHAVLSYVGEDGYPFSIAGEFVADADRRRVEMGPLPSTPREGQTVNLTFSHIHPTEGGYDQRRYVSLWGRAEAGGGRVSVAVERASGWDEAETPFFEYCERGVPRGHEYFEGVGQGPRLGAGWLFFLATRLPFLTATIVPVALGGAVAASHGVWNWGLFWLTLAGASCIHLGLNIANDVFDDASGADAANLTPTPFSGGSRVIQYGLVGRRTMALSSLLFYLVGMGVGVYLAESRGRWLYLLGALGIALSVSYTAPPIRLVDRGVGEIAVGLGFGPITTLGAYFVQAQTLHWEAAYVSIPVAIFIALVLYVNEIPDREGDSAAGKRTLVVRWSRRRVVGAYALAASAAYLLIAAGALSGVSPPWTLAALATAPIARRVWRDLGLHYERAYELMPAIQSNIGLHLFTGLLILAGYLTTIIF